MTLDPDQTTDDVAEDTAAIRAAVVAEFTSVREIAQRPNLTGAPFGSATEQRHALEHLFATNRAQA